MLGKYVNAIGEKNQLDQQGRRYYFAYVPTWFLVNYKSKAQKSTLYSMFLLPSYWNCRY